MLEFLKLKEHSYYTYMRFTSYLIDMVERSDLTAVLNNLCIMQTILLKHPFKSYRWFDRKRIIKLNKKFYDYLLITRAANKLFIDYVKLERKYFARRYYS